MEKGRLLFTAESVSANGKLGNYVELCDSFEAACEKARKSSLNYGFMAVCSYREYKYDDGGIYLTRKVIMIYNDGEPTDA